jgi:hypothetical protein
MVAVPSLFRPGNDDGMRNRFWLTNVMLPHVLAVGLGLALFIAAAAKAPGLQQLHL